MGLHRFTGMGLHRLARHGGKVHPYCGSDGCSESALPAHFREGLEKTVLLLHLLPADHLSFSIKSSPF